MAIVVTTEEQVKSGRRLHSEQLCAHSLPYTSSRDVSIMTVVELDGDHKYVAMPNTYSAGKEGEFLLSIYSSSKIRVKGGEDIEIDSALAVGSDYSDVEELGEVKEDIEEEDEG
uniref:Peptidase C2 calpain large subunit domain-containing protein n=4 Tax=Palpitomonas bilix TaxID=652834 RepID=A0A7S3DGC9_9EUKA|mmetsp:Transcript_35996/g.93640  ORF Transcript_35996/g.93640 Transcript_35996/m.93640 type:complete len:114 (+) Transcript_35996:566-907(+)